MIAQTQKMPALFAVLLVGAWANIVLAQVPQILSYQGYLTDAAGQPLDAPVNVRFSLYIVEMGGTPLWSSTQSVLPERGLFSAELGGQAQPFPPGLFDTQVFLGVQVEGDNEMTPRVGLSSTPYSQKAADASTVGGMSAPALDQSADVTNLETDLSLVQSRLVIAETGIDGNAASVADLQSDVGQIQTSVIANQADIGDLQNDVAVVENTLPTLQHRVADQCPAGSSIRVIDASGGVVCESDDQGPWNVDGGTTYVSTGPVGIGTPLPNAWLHVDSPVGINPLLARLGTNAVFKLHSNGSATFGAAAPGPVNGVYVAGTMGVGTSNPSARLSLNDDDWQMSLRNSDAGGTEWRIGSSADAWSASGGKLVFSPTDSSGNAAMVMDADRNVGIGTVVPETRLHIKGGTDLSAAGGGYLTLGDTGGNNVAIDGNEIMARNGGAASTLALNAEGGLVTVNLNGNTDEDALKVVGDVEFASSSLFSFRIERFPNNNTAVVMVPTAFERGGIGTASAPFFSMYANTFFANLGGGFQFYSDRALKKNIEPIDKPLAIIEKLDGVTFAALNHPNDDGQRERTEEEIFRSQNQLGFIAQDVEKVLPQLVQTVPESGLKTVGYMGVVPVLVEGMKAQQRQIELLEAKLEAQQAQLDALRRLLR